MRATARDAGPAVTSAVPAGRHRTEQRTGSIGKRIVLPPGAIVPVSVPQRTNARPEAPGAIEVLEAASAEAQRRSCP